MKRHKKFYLESLLPEKPYLSSLKNVEIVVSPLVDIDKKLPYIRFKSPVNTHLFKPSYYLNSDNTAVCFCATITVAKHIQKAWKIYSENFKPLRAEIKINGNYSKFKTDVLYSAPIGKLLDKKSIHETVVVGRIDSINAFLKMLYIKNNLKLNMPGLKKLFIELELHRLKHHLLTIHNSQIFEKYLGKATFEKLESDFKMDTRREGKYLGIENTNYKGRNFTIIDLPWGQDLSYVITKKLLNLNKDIRKIFVIGGVGCVSDGIEVDDIFLPNSTQDERGNEIKFQNEFLDTFTDDSVTYTSPSGLFSKKVVKGRLLCVNSSLGHKKNFSHKAKERGISGFDMESYGILRAVKTTKSNIKIYMIHYIMDLPLKGLGLGATYYNRNFLKNLLSNFNRGKYFCFDYVLAHI